MVPGGGGSDAREESVNVSPPPRCETRGPASPLRNAGLQPGSVARMGRLLSSGLVKASDDYSWGSSKDSNFGPVSPKGICGRRKALATALDA